MPLPERLGRLRRVRVLGHGAFATVWLYRDDELRSDVAVKALADNWCLRLDIRERFLEEARILRAADADHVVRVHDIGETDGTPWFVMSYADRGSLEDHLTEGRPWPAEAALALLDQAAAGLGVLHRQGVVHRDVKPQNLLLRSPGGPDAAPGTDTGTAVHDGGPVPRLAPERLVDSQLMVADLGVAKALARASGLTQVVGSPAYMAPEQALGLGVDVRADVHALGAVAHRLLTGRLPGDIPDDHPGGGSPSPAVADVLARAIDPDPDRRPPDVGSFVRELRVALTAGPRPHDPTHAAPPGPRASATTLGGLRLLVAAVLVLLVSFGAAFAVTALTR